MPNLARIVAGVTLDATGTLLHAPRLAAIYAEVLTRHGMPVTAEALVSLLPLVWRELACSAHPARDRFGADPDGPRGFWRRYLDRVAVHLGHADAGRFAADELFDRFAHAAAWEVYPDVRPALSTLRAAGLRLAVVSNWDDRLAGVLAELGLADHLEAVVVASAVGVEKPHRRIYEETLARLRLPPGRVLHVGDHPLEDREGALAVGMRAALLDRRGDRGDLRDLAGLARLCGLPG